MKATLSQRLADSHPKQSLRRFVKFLAPKPGEEALFGGTVQQPLIQKVSSGALETSTDKEFVPYRSERDHLGKLKALSSRRSTQANTAKSRALHLPKLQQSIYNGLSEAGVVEPLDLQQGNRFKVVDGFERQINIIVRNKEFMAFLKEEKSRPRLSREQESQLDRLSESAEGCEEEGAHPGAAGSLSRGV